jgi:hypothetical protein
MSELADDLLEGAEDIARFLGKKWNARRVFNARQRGGLPLHTRPGMGLYAFRSELAAFLRAPESLVQVAKAKPLSPGATNQAD